MNTTIVEFINGQKVGVLAVEMLDGFPHAATVHFAFSENPEIFYFETCREYRKSEPLLAQEQTKASLVIGCDENTKKTLQLDGFARIITEQEKEVFSKVYLEKFPGKQEKLSDPKFIFFVFIPKWWRFTDWQNKDGKIVITSEDK